MIGQTWPEYIFIRASIFGLRLVAPLSIVYLAASWRAHTFLWSPVLGVYALIEAPFFLLVYLPRQYRLQRDAKHPPRMSRAERDALFYKCANSMTPESITNWFLRAPGQRVLRDNVADWLLWALFSARSTEDLREWEEELDSYISVMGDYVGYPIGRGSNLDMQCLRPTMDPVHTVHRPFIWYMIVCLVDTSVSISLHFKGFTHHNTRKWFHAFPPRPLLAFFSRSSSDTVTNIPYWYRPHRSSTKLPVVFIHGIGIGLYPYVPFLSELAAQDPDVGIIAIEILPISMHITAPPLERDVMCAAITRILDAHGLHRVVVAGHSYGTVIAAHLLHRQQGTAINGTTPQGTPEETDTPTIAALLLVDPIPFLLHHPAVAYNFVYRYPRTANEWQLWYFASRDADIARALARHFFWFENILFREDVMGAGKPHVAVSIAGRDQIVDARAVWGYLTGGEEDQGRLGSGSRGRWARDGLEVIYFPELDHATVFDARANRAELLDVLSRFVREDWTSGASPRQNDSTERSPLCANSVLGRK
ncbi:Alpha/Beta hydrolase protein [Lactarius quietus]|nr:Alpha/Beta hydrolase protein [Lactarius quietus]